MGLKKTENQVQVLLKDTILALCRNTLNYHAEICIEGLLCITLDCEEVLLVNINQVIKNQEMPPRRLRKKRKRTAEDSSDEEEIFRGVSPKVKCKRASTNEPSAVVTLLNDQCDNLRASSEESQERDAIISGNLTENPAKDNMLERIKATKDKRVSENHENCKNDVDYSCKKAIDVPRIIKKEQPGNREIIIVKEEIDNDEMLPPGEFCHNYLTRSFNANLSHCKNTFDEPAGYHSSHSQGHVSEEILPNLNHAIGGSDFLESSMASANGSNSLMSPSGPALHVCLLCGKSFAWQWLLKRHQVVHSGDKDYSCEHCQRTFSYQSSVKRHQEKCSARRENLQCNFMNNPPGVSQRFAQGGATLQEQLVYSQNRHEHSRFNFTRVVASCGSSNGALSE